MYARAVRISSGEYVVKVSVAGAMVLLPKDAAVEFATEILLAAKEIAREPDVIKGGDEDD